MISRKLTFACLLALEPRVIKARVSRITTLVEPITAASTTAELAGCFKGAALRTRARERSRGRNSVTRQGGGVFTRGMGLAGFLDVFSRRALHVPGDIARVVWGQGIRIVVVWGQGIRISAFEKSGCARLAFNIGCGRARSCGVRAWRARAMVVTAVRIITGVGIGAVGMRCGVFEASSLTRPTCGRGCGCCLNVFPRRALDFLGDFAGVGLQAAVGHGVFEESAPEVTILALGIRGNSADAFGELARRALFVGNTRAIGTTCRRRRHTALKGVWTTKA